MEQSLESIGISNNKQLKKFYTQWSVNASKLIQQYAKEQSIQWYNTAWRNKSKEIPFYIRMKAPKSFTGNIWMVSSPVNYAYAKDASKYKDKPKAFPKGAHVKPVNTGGKWFTPKKYKPDIKDINISETDLAGQDVRFFASKTSHNKTHKYKKALVWYQNKMTKEVGPVTLDEQLADKIMDDSTTYTLIQEAFEQTVENKKYI